MKERLLQIIAAVSLTLICGCVSQPSPQAHSSGVERSRITIDGDFEDWQFATGSPDIIERTGDPEFNLEGIHTSSDAENVYFLIDIDKELNFQGFDGTLKLLLNTDAEPETGDTHHGMEGVDLMIEFTAPNRRDPDRRGMGIGVELASDQSYQGPDTPVGHAAIGFKMAPTYATDRLEFSIKRHSAVQGISPIGPEAEFTYKLVLLSGKGETSFATAERASRLSADSQATLPAPSIPQKENGHLRVISWNVERGSILKKPEIYSRVLRSLNPDAILLQELTENETEQSLGELFKEIFPAETSGWNILLGKDGAALGCGIASRVPIRRVESIEQIPYPDRPEWTVRALGGELMTENGNQLLLTSVHLKCCGRIDSREDRTRLQEATRINERIRQVVTGSSVDGLILGGDLNLVGSYTPIKNLSHNLDFDRSDLSILNPFALTGRSNSTWSSARSQFAPGRLDYLLFSDSSVQVTRSFILNTADLSATALAQHALKSTDSAEASDHFPVVIDLAWK